MTDDYYDDGLDLLGVPLDEPPAAEPPATLKFPTADEPEPTFLLRGEEPPTDGVYRPRLRGFGDAA